MSGFSWKDVSEGVAYGSLNTAKALKLYYVRVCV